MMCFIIQFVDEFMLNGIAHILNWKIMKRKEKINIKIHVYLILVLNSQ